jgi:hypothetical protein
MGGSKLHQSQWSKEIHRAPEKHVVHRNVHRIMRWSAFPLLCRGLRRVRQGKIGVPRRVSFLGDHWTEIAEGNYGIGRKGKEEEGGGGGEPACAMFSGTDPGGQRASTLAGQSTVSRKSMSPSAWLTNFSRSLMSTCHHSFLRLLFPL